MQFDVIDLGNSRSLPAGDALRSRAETGAAAALIVGGDARSRAERLRDKSVWSREVVLIELGTECLGYYTGEQSTTDSHVLGFARFQAGALPPSALVEIVRRANTSQHALAQARSLFENAGIEVSVCSDVPGRIVDNLLRPYLNSALRSVDERLATPSDLDQALRLGLGFPKGPIELLEASGLAEHFEITSALYQACGATEFVPARRARVEATRARDGLQ